MHTKSINRAQKVSCRCCTSTVSEGSPLNQFHWSTSFAICLFRTSARCGYASLDSFSARQIWNLERYCDRRLPNIASYEGVFHIIILSVHILARTQCSLQSTFSPRSVHVQSTLQSTLQSTFSFYSDFPFPA